MLMLLIGQAANTPALPQLMMERIIVSLPLSFFDAGLRLLGGTAKPLFFAVIAIGIVAVGGGAGVVWARTGGAIVSPPRGVTGRKLGWYLKTLGWGVGFSTGLWLLAVIIVLPLIGGPFLGGPLPRGAFWFMESFAFGLFSASIFLWLVAFSGEKAAEGAIASPSRRELIRRLPLAIMGLALVGTASKLVIDLIAKGGLRSARTSATSQLPSEITPNKDFYTVSKNFIDPVVNVREWKLEVGGLVESPFALSYEQLKALPSVEQIHTLICISNEVGGDLISNAAWKGVPMRDLLRMAGVKDSVTEVKLTAWDDYTESFSIDKALEKGTVLAYEMNGEPLPPEHGFPARLLVPGIYGMKNVKWLTRIEAIDYDYKGFWQEQGWSDIAIIKTMSRIDVPSRFGGTFTLDEARSLGGIAFAGERGVSKVEISLDGGRTWEEGQVRKAPSPNTWVLWVRSWNDPQPGRYILKVRATDGKGQLQEDEYTDTLPDGASGYHMVGLTVEES
ncbi:MAG: molybdopterin-dependent oxidoreductase [Chloroflexi bacterium]|nr:molybdopterin-dependent oxidoreductase [Chloroflexota bacterium]